MANVSSTMAAMSSAPLPREPAPNTPRRQQILAAAAELFAHRGFHGVGIDDIGAAVGISGPGVYRHFRSKDAVLGDLLIGIGQTLLAGGEERVRSHPEPAAALAALVGFQVGFALDNPALVTVQARDLANLAETDRRRVRRLQRRYVEVWVDVIRRVSPACTEPAARAAAHAVLGLISSTPHGSVLDRPTLAALLTRMAVAAACAAGPPQLAAPQPPAAPSR
jgi:AcrR family transcriptional regulator